MMKEACLLLLAMIVLVSNVNALVGPIRTKGVRSTSPISFHTEPQSYRRNLVVLDAKKKKRRRRKQAPKAGTSDTTASPAAPTTPTVSATVVETKPAESIAATPPADAVVEKSAPAIAKEEIEAVSTPPPAAPAVASNDDEPATEEDMSNILEVASFKFEPDDAITKGACAKFLGVID